MTDLTPDLQYLVGEPMSAVSFVMDYVELQFNESYLRCLNPPAVQCGDARHIFPEPGSRDALCALIGATVTAIRGVVGSELRVDFSDGSTVFSSLAPSSGGEVLHFHNWKTDETQWW